MRLVEIERYDTLSDRIRSWTGPLLDSAEADRVLATLPERGTRFHFLPRLVIAAISAASGLLLWAFLAVIEVPAADIVVGILCIVASEWVQRSFGWRHTGSEEGWMVTGAVLLVFAFLSDRLFESDGTFLALTAAIAVGASVVRAPVFHGVAAAVFCAWLDLRASETTVIIAALVLAVVVAYLRGYEFLSPYVETSLKWVQLTFSLVAASYGVDHPLLAAFLAAIVLLVGIGLWWRDTLTLWSAVPLVITAAYEVGSRIPLPREWKLMLGGGAVIGAAWILERALRTPRGGWTSVELARDESDLIEIAGAIAITPAREPAGETGGGEFGGGGATDRY